VLAAWALVTGSVLRLGAPAGVLGPAPRLVLSLAANLGLLMAAWGAVALAIAAMSRRRVIAVSITGITAFVAFLADYTARLWDPMKNVAWLSPFHYVQQSGLVAGGALALRDVAVLLGITVAGVAVALIAISRRDL
jgi:ABC-2 type transport system permease protein